MEAADFIRLLRRPRSLDIGTLAELEQKLAQFPYCSALRVLYLKNLHLLSSEKFSEELKVSAVLIPDRKKLFESVHETATNSAEIQVATSTYTVESAFEKEEYSEYADSRFFSTLNKKEISHEHSGNSLGLPAVEDEENELELEEKIDLSADDDFITESLALVFEKKGKIKEAIKTYEKLCLKYPEKSTYFATQIQNLSIKL